MLRAEEDKFTINDAIDAANSAIEKTLHAIGNVDLVPILRFIFIAGIGGVLLVLFIKGMVALFEDVRDLITQRRKRDDDENAS